MKNFHRLLYGALGVVFIALGALGFLSFGPSSGDPEQDHLESELGAAGIFVGLMCFW